MVPWEELADFRERVREWDTKQYIACTQAKMLKTPGPPGSNTWLCPNGMSDGGWAKSEEAMTPLPLQLYTSASHLGSTILMAAVFELWWGVWNTLSTHHIRYLLKWKPLRSVSTHSKCHMYPPGWTSVFPPPLILFETQCGSLGRKADKMASWGLSWGLVVLMLCLSGH